VVLSLAPEAFIMGGPHLHAEIIFFFLSLFETRFIVGFLFVRNIFLFNLTRLSRDGFMRRSSVIIFFKFLY
jgi:hypothetical protein